MPPRCQNGAVNGWREWWDSKGRAVTKKNALEADNRHQQRLAGVSRLQDLTDEELIAAAPATGGSSLSKPPHHEMEMQRRLKVATEDLTRETERARHSASRWSLAIAFLTVVLIALTVILAMRA